MKVQVHQFADGSGVPSLAPPEKDTVHVWHARTQPACVDPSQLAPMLSEDERQRASRFRFQKNRDEFLISHGMLRMLLGSYLSIAPQEVCFQYGSHGKPGLDCTAVQSTLSFNISHTDGLALCAFSSRLRIGVDVEKVRKDFNTTEIAERFFSLVEREALRCLPAQEQHEAFFRCWTRKEAYIKALGEGLSHPLHQFDVSLTKTAAALLATRPEPSETGRWFLHAVPLPEGYVGAVAVETAPRDLSSKEPLALERESLHS